jgi:hypothetical protein
MQMVEGRRSCGGGAAMGVDGEAAIDGVYVACPAAVMFQDELLAASPRNKSRAGVSGRACNLGTPNRNSKKALDLHAQVLAHLITPSIAPARMPQKLAVYLFAVVNLPHCSFEPINIVM